MAGGKKGEIPLICIKVLSTDYDLFISAPIIVLLLNIIAPL